MGERRCLAGGVLVYGIAWSIDGSCWLAVYRRYRDCVDVLGSQHEIKVATAGYGRRVAVLSVLFV